MNKKEPSMVDHLSWLQTYFADNCNGEWEHDYGVEITTTDNPGWSVTIDVAGTDHEDMVVELLKIERSESDWLIFGRDDKAIFGRGGRDNLGEVLAHLRTIMAAADEERARRAR